VTNALFASLHRLDGRPFALRPRLFRSAKPRASHERQFCWPQERRPSVCGSAAALRSDSVPAVSPSALHFFRLPTADRSKIEQFAYNFPDILTTGMILSILKR